MPVVDWTPGSTGWVTLDDYLKDQEKPRTVNKELGQREFLSLIAAQLKYQDPMEPQKDTDFIAQLAQFQSLESLTALSETTQMSQYYAMTGKYVYAKAKMPDGTTQDVEGYINYVVKQNGKAYAQIGGYDFLVECTAITEVYDDKLLSSDNSLVNNSHLIGKTVTAIEYYEVPMFEDVPKKDADGNIIYGDDKKPIMETVPVLNADNTPKTETKERDVTGVVVRMTIDKGIVYAHIQTKDLDSAGNQIVKKISIKNVKDIASENAPPLETEKPEKPEDTEDSKDPDDSENTGTPEETE